MATKKKATAKTKVPAKKKAPSKNPVPPKKKPASDRDAGSKAPRQKLTSKELTKQKSYPTTGADPGHEKKKLDPGHERKRADVGHQRSTTVTDDVGHERDRNDGMFDVGHERRRP
jgi:hypothetical protein